MTTVQAAELLRKKYLGGDSADEAGMDLQDFLFAINQSSAYVKKGEYFKIQQTGETAVPDTWMQTFVDLPVVFNETQGLYECELPQQPMDLAKGRGVQLVCPMQDPTNPFFPMSESENWMFSGLPATYTSYWIINKTLQFKNLDPKYTSIKAVYCPMFSDDVQDDLAYQTIEIAFAQFLKGKMIPEDKNTNQSPNLENNGNRQ